MFDNPLILVIIVVAALLRWLSQKSETTNSDPERPVVPDQPIPRGGETKTEEERVRRFLEALGHPVGTEPPPKVTRKREVRPRVFPTLPPLTAAPPPVPSPPASAVSIAPPVPIQQPVFTPALAQEGSFEVRDLSAATPGDVIRGQGFLRKLRSAQDLRDAIVLREVFGPPRGLQTPDPISGF